MLTLRLLLTVFAAAICNVQAAELAFENAIVLDPATESTHAGTLLVRDTHVVGLIDSVPSDFQGERIDLGGRWVIPGLVALTLFAFLLTKVDSLFAGRAYAAYGGVYIVASLGWLWAVEGMRPDRWDLTGAVVCVTGAAIILLVPRVA